MQPSGHEPDVRRFALLAGIGVFTLTWLLGAWQGSPPLWIAGVSCVALGVAVGAGLLVDAVLRMPPPPSREQEPPRAEFVPGASVGDD